MVFEILSVFCIFISAIGWGTWLKFLLSLKHSSIAITSIAGLSFLSLISFIISTFHPLNTKIEVLCILVSVIPYFFKKFNLYSISTSFNSLKSRWFWIFFFIILLAGSYFPFNSDHFGYYVPTLNWINQYGTITGVATIDWTLGQMSSFHIIQACFDSTLDIFLRLNVFITIVFLVYIFERKSFLLLLFIPFYFLYIQSATPDIIISFLGLIITNEVCFYWKKNDFGLILLISVFTFAIKPVAFWLPLWVWLVGIYLYRKKILKFTYYIVPCLLILFFLLKNFIASSTLVFPATFTKIPTFWLTDSRILAISKQEAAYYAFDNHFTPEIASSFSIRERIYYWLTLHELQTIINIFIVIISIISGVFSFLTKKFIYISLWCIVMCKFIMIFLFSGQYRFFLDGIFPLLFILLLQIRFIRFPNLFFIFSVYLAVLLSISQPKMLEKIFPQFKLTKHIHGFSVKALLRPENYTLKRYTKAKLGNMYFHITTNYRYNFDTPAPAFTIHTLKLYYNLNIFPQLKDSSCIRKGIFMKPLSKKEKEELAELIKKYDLL